MDRFTKGAAETGLAGMTVPLDPADKVTEMALRSMFEEHWANPPADLRACYDGFVAQTPMADGVRFTQVETDGIRGWWCRPANAVLGRTILYIHGGGYICGSATAYRGIASQIAYRAEAATFVLDYPLAPEHKLPLAFDSIAPACRWLAREGAYELALVGDSAGGGLALAALASAPFAGRPVNGSPVKGSPANRSPVNGSPVNGSLAIGCPVVGCVAFSPWTDLALTGATISAPDIRDPVLSRTLLRDSARHYVGDRNPRDPRASPLYGKPVGLPPLYIQVGSDELLLDDARRYAALAARHGVSVRLEIWQDLHHNFQFHVKELASSRRALDQAAVFLMNRFNDRH